MEETFRARKSKPLADLQEKEKAYADIEQWCTVMQEQLEASQAEIQTKNQQVKQYKTQVDRCKEQITTLEVLLQQSGQPDGGYRGGGHIDGGYHGGGHHDGGYHGGGGYYK